jgi:hypothetical protein
MIFFELVRYFEVFDRYFAEQLRYVRDLFTEQKLNLPFP